MIHLGLIVVSNRCPRQLCLNELVPGYLIHERPRLTLIHFLRLAQTPEVWAIVVVVVRSH